jgi:hypothetical protein
MCGPEAPPKQSTGMESSCECAAIASNSPKQKAADSGLFTSDEFRMYCMKVLPCSKVGGPFRRAICPTRMTVCFPRRAAWFAEYLVSGILNRAGFTQECVSVVCHAKLKPSGMEPFRPWSWLNQLVSNNRPPT